MDSLYLTAPWDQHPPPMMYWGQFGVVVIPRPCADNIDVAKSCLSLIRTSAQRLIKREDYVGALWKYLHGIAIAQYHGLSEDVQRMRIESASIGLEVKGSEELYSLGVAFGQASNGIVLAPDCAELYYFRAEAMKRRFFFDKRNPSCSSPFFSHDALLDGALKDYCTCFSIDSEKTDALVEAIVLAVDYELNSYLPILTKEQVSNGTGMKILRKLVNRPSVVGKYLKHFIFKMHPDASCNECSVSFCKFVKKGILNESVLTRLLQIGIKVASKDIEDLINILSEDEGVAVLTFALAKCSASAPDITAAATAAVTCKKFIFLSTLINSGATPSVSNIIECTNWTSLDPNILSYVITKGTPKDIAQLMIKGLKVHHADPQQLMKDLCQYKCVTCSKEVIGEILKDDDFKIIHIKLLCLLLNSGANSLDLCQGRYEKATPLHVATELALESESTDIISAVIKCADFKLPEDGRVIDENGNCPYHLVVRSNKKDPIKVTVCTALSQLCPPLDPTVKDRPKKTKKKETLARMAKDYVPKEGKVYKCLLIAEQLFSSSCSSMTHHVCTSEEQPLGAGVLIAATAEGNMKEQYGSTEGHIITTDEDLASAKGHYFSVEGDPVGERLIREGHFANIDEHSVSAERHPVSAEGHPFSAEGHPFSTEGHHVTANLGHPVVAEEHPVVAEEHPVVAEGHPVSAEEHPVSAEGHPVVAEEHPVVVKEHPVSAEGHPVVAEEHPVVAEEHPVVAEEHPVVAEGHPVSAEGHPVVAEEHPVVAKEHPVSAEGHPVVAEEHPVVAEEHPVVAEEHPVVAEGHPVSAEGHPVVAEEHPVSAEEHPVVAEGHPVVAEEHPVSAEEHPVVAEEHPVVAEEHPVSAEGHPVVAEGHPVSAEGHPVVAEEHPVSAEDSCVGMLSQDHTKEHLQKGMEKLQLIKEISDSTYKIDLFLNAAALFRQANELPLYFHSIKSAAVCLMKLTPPKYREAAQLYEYIGQTELALKVCKKAKDFWYCVHILDKAGLSNEALTLALECENNGTKLADMGVECLAHKYARLYSTQKNIAMLETVLTYIPDHSAKARYWRRCGHYEKAIEIYIEKKMFEHAFRLMSCLGWYDRGLELARKENDKKWIVNFAVEGAKASLHDHQTLDTGALECLEGLLRDRDVSGHNKLVPIIHLLVGCGGGKAEHITEAAKMFGEQGNIIGKLESYGNLLKLFGFSQVSSANPIQNILEFGCTACQLSCMLSSVKLEDLTPSQQYVFQLCLDFYGITSCGGIYCFHPKQNVWLGDLKQCEGVDNSGVLIDGMSRIDINEFRLVLAKRLNELGSKILEDAEMEMKLGAEFKILTKSLLCSSVKDFLFQTSCISPDDLQHYISVHINLLKYCYIVHQSTDGPIGQLLTLFSPNMSPHLPPGLLHLKLVRSSTLVCESIFRWLLEKFHHIKDTSPEEHNTDVWLVLWKASCIVGKGGEELRTLVKELAQKANGDCKSNCQNHNIDEMQADKNGYNGNDFDLSFRIQHSVHQSKEKTTDISINCDSCTKKSATEQKTSLAPYICILDKYTHHFELWLHSCFLIRNHGEIVSSAQFVIKYFLSHIAVTAKRGSQIMVMNVVEILSIHSTALLGVIMRSQHRLSGKAPVFAVPHLYECVIETFDDLNTYGRGGYRLLEACAHQADICPEVGLKELSSNALQLLRHSLDLLLGVLKFALYDPKLLSLGLSSHSEILVLTILANIFPLCQHDHTLLHWFVKVIREPYVLGCPMGCPHDITSIMSVSDWSNNVFKLIQILTQQHFPNSPGLVQMSCDQGIQISIIPRVTDLRNYQTVSLHVEKWTLAGWNDHGSDLQSIVFSKPQDDSQSVMGGGDPLMVTMGYCCACKLHLERSQMEEHMTTAAHQQKVQLLQEYNTMERECLQLQQRLQTTLLYLKDSNHHGNQCAKQIHDVEAELEWNSSIFDDIKCRSSWERHVEEVKQMKERVDLLCS